MWGGRYRRPQTFLAVTVRNEVIWTRHKFLKPPADDLSFRNTKDLVEADMTPIQKLSLMTGNVSDRSKRLHSSVPVLSGQCCQLQTWPS